MRRRAWARIGTFPEDHGDADVILEMVFPPVVIPHGRRCRGSGNPIQARGGPIEIHSQHGEHQVPRCNGAINHDTEVNSESSTRGATGPGRGRKPK